MGKTRESGDLVSDNLFSTDISNDLVGIGSTQPSSKLDVDGDVNVSGAITATTFTGALDGNAGTATALENARNFSVTGDFVTASAVSFDGTSAVALAATITTDSIILGTYTSGDYVESVSGTANEIQVTGGTGEGSTPTIGFVANPTIGGNVTIGQDLTVTRDLQVTRNLNVDGTVTIGGTSATIFAETLKISDPDIVLGFRSDANGNDISNDTTASHGGVALASTEGSPLVNLVGVGETLPTTYKKIMWFKTNSFTGLNTDAWLSNYAFGVGTTSMSSGTKFAVGNIEANFDDFTAVRNINSSGIITATNLNITGITTLGGDVKIDGDITSRFLTIVSTDSGSGAEPVITLRRDSSSPAADDKIGELRFSGENSSGQVREYASITGKIVSPTLLAEKGAIETRISGFLVSTQTSTLLNLQNNVNVSGALTATSLSINDFDIRRKSGDIQITNDTGDLLIAGAGGATTIKLQPDFANNSITANSGGSVELFFNNNKKLETVTSGVDITGSLDISGQAIVNSSVNIADKIIHIGDTDTSIGFPSNDTFAIETAGSERVRIDSSGRLLHGTSSERTNYRFNATSIAPLFQLESTGGSTAFGITRNSDSGNAGTIYLAKSRGTTDGSNTIVQQGDRLGSLSFNGADGTDLVTAARIDAEVDGTPGTNDMPGRLLFFTTSNGGSTPQERMRITSAGNVGIGTENPASIPGFKLLHIQGDTGIALGGGAIQLSSTTTGDFGQLFNFNNALFAGGSEATYLGTGDAAIGSFLVGYYIESNGPHIWYDPTDGVTERMRITSAGNVGINETNPAEKLTVDGTILTTNAAYSGNVDVPYLIAGTSSYTGATTNWGTRGFQHRLKSNSGGTPRVTIDDAQGNEAFSVLNGGNIGIGTDAPGYKLEVNGDIKVGELGTLWFSDASGSIEKIESTGSALNLYADSTISFYESDASTVQFTVNTNTGTAYLQSDSDTYWYHPAANTHAWTTSNVERFRIGSDGFASFSSNALGTTAGNTQDLLQVSTTNTNSSYLKIFEQRDVNGSDWTSSCTRIQKVIDVTEMGYIQFNGNGNTYGMEFGTFGDEKFAVFERNGPVHLYYDNSKVFETTSIGVKIPSASPAIVLNETDVTTASRFILSGSYLYIQSGASGSGEATSSGNIRITGYNGADLSSLTVRTGGAYNTLWHAGNDGSGSGLDADTVDGISSASFLRSDANDSATGQITLSGGVSSNGKDFYSNNGAFIANDADGAFATRTGNNIDHIWHNDSSNTWHFCSDTTYKNGGNSTVYAGAFSAGGSTVWHAGNDGSGSGLDADLLDGVQGSSYLRSDANDTYDNGQLDIRSNSTNGHYWGVGIEWSSGWKHTNTNSWGFAFRNSAGILDIYSSTAAGTAGATATYKAFRIGGSSSLLQYDGNNIWHAGNDGAGSGLDADTLDGLQSSQFLRSDTASEITAPLIIDSDNNVNGALRIENIVSNTDNDFYFAQEISQTLSGSQVATADREQGGIYMDINSTNTGGDTSNEHRAYGIYIDLDSTGDADVVNGIYVNATATPSTGTVSNIYAGYFFAEDNGGAGAVSNVHGVQAFAYSDNANSDTNTQYAGYFKAYCATDSAAVGSAHGVYGEIEINGTTDIYGNCFAFRAEIDNNTNVAQTNTTYLFYGNYTGTFPTTAYGIYITDNVESYFGGPIVSAQNITAFSDITLKENIEVIPNALDKVSQIRGITFDRIDIDDEPRQSGVIAQEVEKVLPEVVRTAQDGTKTVAYGNMVGLLIEAIKEQQKQIDDLKAKLGEGN